MGIGDELMVAGRARVAQMTDPRRVRVVFGRPRWDPVWDHNPRLARPGEEGDFQILQGRAGGLRPYIAARTPKQWKWKAYQPPSGEIYFTDEEKEYGRHHAGRVVLEPTIKASASPNKQWGWTRWNKLAWLLQEEGVRVTQLGPEGGVQLLDGADFVATRDFRLAASVLAHARAVVAPEGGLHHAAAAVGVPALVIFGGFISPEVTGYRSQVSFYAGGEGLGCGMRTPCDHCADAMASITPREVADKLMEVLVETSRRRVVA